MSWSGVYPTVVWRAGCPGSPFARRGGEENKRWTNEDQKSMRVLQPVLCFASKVYGEKKTNLLRVTRNNTGGRKNSLTGTAYMLQFIQVAG
jgi:hypothetical protein